MATGPEYAGICTGPVRIALPPTEEQPVLAKAASANAATLDPRAFLWVTVRQAMERSSSSPPILATGAIEP
jgi:hypothetical protein